MAHRIHIKYKIKNLSCLNIWRQPAHEYNKSKRKDQAEEDNKRHRMNISKKKKANGMTFF